jgi:hypothetical protein
MAANSYHPIGDELLVAVFNSFPKKKPLKFKDESYIMQAFYKASKKNKYSSLFRNYSFDRDGITPYSREIAEGINILHQTSMLGKMNPTFSFHFISSGVEIRFKRFIEPKLTVGQKKLLGELSKEIKSSLISK